MARRSAKMSGSASASWKTRPPVWEVRLARVDGPEPKADPERKA
jgi:hypothetical protein